MNKCDMKGHSSHLDYRFLQISVSDVYLYLEEVVTIV